VPVGSPIVKLVLPEPLFAEAAARSVIPPDDGVGVGVGVDVGVEVGVGVGVDVGVGVGFTVGEGSRAMSMVMSELAAPLRVPWTVPVALVEEKSSCDISEVVELLLWMHHSSTNPVGAFTEVMVAMPTM